jgi:hypothetical protein
MYRRHGRYNDKTGIDDDALWNVDEDDENASHDEFEE